MGIFDWQKGESPRHEMTQTDNQYIARLMQELKWRGDNSTLYSLAQDKDLPTDVLLSIYSRCNDGLKSIIASNKNAPVDLLVKLASHEDAEVRRGVAKNPATLAYLLEELSHDSSAPVRQEVAWNPNVSLDVLQRLAMDADGYVRAAVAASSVVAPIDVLGRLGTDHDSYVRSCAARSQAAPTALVLELLSDEVDDVRKNAAMNPSLPRGTITELCGSEDKSVVVGVACNPSLSPSDVDVLVARKEFRYWIEEHLARNSSTPRAVLLQMAKKTGLNRASVKIEVIFNKNSDEGILEMLASDDAWEVRERVAMYTKSKSLLTRLSTDESLQVRVHIAGNRETPAGIIRNLEKDVRINKRVFACNPTTPIDILEELTHNADNETACFALLTLANKTC